MDLENRNAELEESLSNFSERYNELENLKTDYESIFDGIAENIGFEDENFTMKHNIPGVLGSAAGAYLLSDVIDGDVIKPFIAVYMIALAIIIIRKASQKNIIKKKTKRLSVLASFGGFMDAVGGGGWGPIVTSTLLGRGRNPRYTIGSVNAAEFAVSFASGVTFMLFGGIEGWQVIIGLILGGVIAAPIAAILVNKIKRQPMMIAVGILIIILSLRTLSKLL